MGHTLLILVIYVLACARITRLVNGDTITDPIRLAVARRADTGENPKASAAERRRWSTLADFLQCPWCVGFWMSLAAAVVPVHLLGWPVWTILPVGLACSHLIGVFAFAADTDDVDIVDVVEDD